MIVFPDTLLFLEELLVDTADKAFGDRVDLVGYAAFFLYGVGELLGDVFEGAGLLAAGRVCFAVHIIREVLHVLVVSSLPPLEGDLFTVARFLALLHEPIADAGMLLPEVLPGGHVSAGGSRPFHQDVAGLVRPAGRTVEAEGAVHPAPHLEKRLRGLALMRLPRSPGNELELLIGNERPLRGGGPGEAPAHPTAVSAAENLLERLADPGRFRVGGWHREVTTRGLGDGRGLFPGDGLRDQEKARTSDVAGAGRKSGGALSPEGFTRPAELCGDGTLVGGLFSPLQKKRQLAGGREVVEAIVGEKGREVLPVVGRASVVGLTGTPERLPNGPAVDPVPF